MILRILDGIDAFSDQLASVDVLPYCSRWARSS
jgi:hypothetical protein